MPTVLTLEKSLSILEAITSAPEGIGTRALAKMFGLNVATVHNIAMTFVARGYLRQDEHTRHFHAGLRLHLLGRISAGRQPLIAAARSTVRKLADELNESVMFVALDGSRHLANLAFRPSRQALRVHEPEDIGDVAHCTAVGKVLLAHLTPAQLSTYLAEHALERHTARTITTRKALLTELAQIRDQGFAQTNGELCEGISARAIPVRDPWGKVFASIGTSAPTARLQDSKAIAATLAALQAAAADLEQSLRIEQSSLPR